MGGVNKDGGAESLSFYVVFGKLGKTRKKPKSKTPFRKKPKITNTFLRFYGELSHF